MYPGCNESWGFFPIFRRICGRSLLLAYLIIRKYLCLEFRTFGVFLGCILCNCKTFGKVEVWLVIFYLGFSISLRLKFSLLNKTAEFMIELNIFVIYNLFFFKRYVCSGTFCSKINLNFLWSEILLQRYGFFAIFAIFWT